MREPKCLFCGKPLGIDRICEEACLSCGSEVYWEHQRKLKKDK